MKKWEYKQIRNIWFLSADALNVLGADSWELISVTVDSLNEAVAYFKRIIK